MLVEGLVREADKWDVQYHIAQSGFDGRASCELPEPIHDWGELDQCCGEYPHRFDPKMTFLTLNDLT